MSFCLILDIRTLLLKFEFIIRSILYIKALILLYFIL